MPVNTRARSCVRPPASGRSSTSSSTTRARVRCRSSWPPPGCATPTTTCHRRHAGRHLPIARRPRGRRRRRPRSGPNVTGLRGGRPRRASFLPGCGRCRYCANGHAEPLRPRREPARRLAGRRRQLPRCRPPTARTSARCAGIGTFCRGHRRRRPASRVKVDKDIPLEVACLVGCGVGTGWGSAVKAGRGPAGDTVIVMGIGGIGINAVQGAAHAGASHVIAVDPVEFKREKALELGATHAFATMEEAADFARSVTNGQGADTALVTVGVPKGEHVAAGVRRHPQGRHRRRHRHRRRRPTSASRSAVRACYAVPEGDPGRAVRRLEPRAPTSRRCCGSTRRASSSSTS